MSLVFNPPQATMGPQQDSQVGGLNFLGRIKQAWQDPNMRQAVMSAGLNLMRTPQLGQNGWDTAANALQAGMGTLEGLRERDRKRNQENEDRRIREEQRGIENKRGDRQVDISQQNADTNKQNVEGDQKHKSQELMRAEAALQEAIRHNKSQEEIDRLKAAADHLRATAYFGSAGRTPAEIEKINRMKAYAKDKLGMDDLDADKYAMDYVSTAKGKSPRQLVMDAYQKKAQQWLDQQYDPTAQPTPEMREAWKKQAMEEVRFAEEAGKDVTETRGVIQRPPAPAPAAPGSPPAVRGAQPPAGPGAAPAAGALAQKSPATERSIERWKLANATPQQIKDLISAGGENPAIYGY